MIADWFLCRTYSNLSRLHQVIEVFQETAAANPVLWGPWVRLKMQNCHPGYLVERVAELRPALHPVVGVSRKRLRAGLLQPAPLLPVDVCVGRVRLCRVLLVAAWCLAYGR